MSVSCPHCGTVIAESPSTAGLVVGCPNCGGSLTMPLSQIGNQQLMPAPPHLSPSNLYPESPPPFQPSTTVHVHRERPLPRLTAGDWFTRAFAASSGYFLAAMLFGIGVPAIGMFLCCGGAAMFSDSLPDSSPRPTRTTALKPSKPDRVTLANFYRVRTGMSKTQVFSILGEERVELSSEVEIGNLSTQLFTWTARSSFGNCNVTFQNGEVVSKAQFGLR